MRAVIPSWNFGDLLAFSLKGWVHLIGANNIRVVSHPDDDESRTVAQRHQVELVVTKDWTKDDAKVNKAAALDAGFHDVQVGDVCLALDADVAPLPHGALPKEKEIERDTVYGCRRYSVGGNFEQVANIPFIEKHGRGDSPESCGGYFQLFRFNGIRFGSYPSAGGYDYYFAFKFAKGQTLDSIRVRHFGERHRHWTGRRTTT